MRIIFLLLLCVFSSGYHVNRLVRRGKTTLNANKVPPMWKLVSAPLKEKARKWFIKRAALKGIDWNKITDVYKLPSSMAELENLKNMVENKTLCYPEYFLQPFHGYDEGNMNWLAAQENEAAALSMSANYWKGLLALDSEQWVRYNVTKNVRNYLRQNELVDPEYILDVGCSGGISTEYIYRGFPNATYIYGLDLSPYFVAVGAFRAKKSDYKDIRYIHANAERTSFQDGSFQLIICNFLFHEVPQDATQVILREIYRLLSDNGVIAIVDLDPETLRSDRLLSQFRKWAFEVTEPHIYGYYESNMTVSLEKNGFQNLRRVKNDPINSIWFGTKCEERSVRNEVIIRL